MPLMTRIARLFKADLHSILDTLEEPSAVLKQSVRDMAAEIERNEARRDALNRRAGQLANYVQEEERLLKETTQAIELCFHAGDERLCRSQVRRRLEIEKRLALAGRERAALAAERDKLAAELGAQQAKLSAIREQMALFVQEEQLRTPADASSYLAREDAVTDEAVEVAFLAEKERRAAAANANG
ncbi:MAG: PspA/IM30 family protein [Gammaproteobacteria bacterium]